VFDMKVDQKPLQPVSLGLICEDDGCAKSVDLAKYLNNSEISQFSTYKFALTCFTAEPDALLDKLNGAFVVTTDGALDITVSNIKVLPYVESDALTSCDVMAN